MAEKLVLNYDDASGAIREIAERIENIASASKVFRGEIEDAYDKSDLAFLKRVSQSMGEIETASKQLQENFVEIQDALNAYIREFEDYSDDATGFPG